MVTSQTLEQMQSRTYSYIVLHFYETNLLTEAKGNFPGKGCSDSCLFQIYFIYRTNYLNFYNTKYTMQN